MMRLQKTKTKIICFLFALVDAFALAGCGTGGSDNAMTSSTEATVTEQPYDVRYEPAGCVITNLRFNENEDKSTLIIPETYNGYPVVEIALTRDIDLEGDKTYWEEISKVIIPKTVKEISDYAFYGMSNLETVEFAEGSALESVGNGAFMNCKSLAEIALPDAELESVGEKAFMNCESLTEIALPAKVKEISDYAFCGMSNLETAEFAEGSALESVGEGAFMNCKSLAEIVLPDTVKDIEMGAFNGCSSIQSFTVGKNVTFLSGGNFIGCDKLTEISVAEGNAVFSAQDGVLFNEKKTELFAYPQGRADVSYTVPSQVMEIGAYAFAGNGKLQSLDLNQAVMIREGGLSDCSALTTVAANSLKYTEADALDGTAWLENQTDDQVILGEALLRYQGEAATVSLQKVSSIAPYAFAGNTHLQTLILDSPLHNIGDGAFSQCENLQKVYITNVHRMIDIAWSAFGKTTAKIYIPEIMQGEYAADEGWKPYKGSMELLTTALHFDSNGGSEVSDGILRYGSWVGELPVPTKPENRFIGWKYDDGTGMKFIDSAYRWMEISDRAEFVAEWTPVRYSIVLNPDRGTVENFEGLYTSEEGKTLPLPTREGYVFMGWYDNASFSGNPITEIEPGSTGNKTYYAKWQEAEYTVTLDYGYEGCPASLTAKVPYNKSFTLPVPERQYYMFNGWKTAAGMFYTDENGESVKVWDKAGNETLIADWTREEYVIIVDPEGGSVIILGGVSDKEALIPYGTAFKDTDKRKSR